MSTRLRRTGRSFAAVFVAFWIYRLLVAPWIDPSFVLDQQAASGKMAFAPVGDAVEERLRKYTHIFPPGSWELDEPIMLESEGVELLMKDYENLSGGRIRLSQCTMLYVSDRKGGEQPGGRVVVLRAPEGAILQFDADLNLRRGKVGNLIGGQLIGPVAIHGTPSRPGADDELHINTRDVHLKDQQVWSHSVVDFRYGPNYGTGQELQIHLLPGGASRRGGLSVGGIERIELLRDVKMHMQSGSMGLFPGDEDAVADDASLRPSSSGPVASNEPPIEIQCQGPFSFNLVSRTASFDNQVDVFRVLPQGVSDRMSCDRLQIFFGDRGGAASSDPQAIAGQQLGGERRLSLQPERLLAVGNPVAVDAPSNGLFVRANQLEYTIERRRVRVDVAPGRPDASLTWKDAQLDGEFSGRSLIVERADPKRLPVIDAAGEGSLRIAEPAEASRVLHASWSRELHLRPVDGGHLVSVLGDAHANFVEFGDLRAGEIQLWLVELDHAMSRAAPALNGIANNNGRDKRKYPVTPKRMVAKGSVRFDSPQLSGDTETLDVSFDPAGTLLPTPVKRSSSDTRSAAGLFGLNRPPAEQTSAGALAPFNVTNNQPASGAPGAGRASGDAAAQPANNAAVAQNSPPQQHFELHGDSIAVDLVSHGQLTALNHATLNGRVHLLETRTQSPTDRPIEVRGDWLEVKNAAIPRQTTMVVKGRQALVAAQGMEMQGATINLDRSQNLLWIDGAGRTVLPPGGAAPNGIAPSNDTRVSATRGQAAFSALDSLSEAPVSIDFAGGMRFDGKTARYSRQVRVCSESHGVRADQVNPLEIRRRTVETDTVEVTMRRPIDFATPEPAENTEVANIAFRGPVRMTQEASDNRGPLSFETLLAHDLTIDQATGDLQAFGPGSLETIRLGSANPLGPQNAARPAASPSKTEGPVYVRVDYQGNITGNVHGKQLVLHDDIRGVYGPVERWGEKLDLNAAKIGKDEIRFRSDELHVRQVPGVQPNTTAVELEAIGNADVDGQAFSARAHRLTYVQGKDQLIFEGDGRSVAELYQQSQDAGGRNQFRAGRLVYRISTGDVDVRKGQFFELGQTLVPSGPVQAAR